MTCLELFEGMNIKGKIKYTNLPTGFPGKRPVGGEAYGGVDGRKII